MVQITVILTVCLDDAAYEALYPYSRDKFFSRSEILGVKPKVHLPIPVRYYGQLFETVYISKDGLLGFDPDIGFSQNQWRNGLPELSVAADKPFISPFHHNGLLSDLYTRHNPDDQRTVDRDREEFMKDTDRLLLAQCQAAGMNGGGGRGWTDVVKCSGACSKKRDQRIMSSLPYLKGSDESGRYIFLVSDDVIIRGGCAPSDSKVSSVVHAVEVYPRKVEMLGGEVIEVSGRCQTAYSTVYCRFDGKEVTEGRMTSAMRGRCHVPRLTSRGQVKLEVSDNRNDWHVYTFINVIPPDHVERLRDREDMRPWFDIRPTQLTVSWDPHQLYENQDARVDIVIVGYRERYGQGTM
nr:hypothetical protein BaRGS_013873 [Batillaria attramentaria]